MILTVAGTVEEWLEEQADRRTALQRAQVETAKLMATFIAAVAATFVATALQVGPPGIGDVLGAVAFAGTVVFTWRVVSADRLTIADEDELCKRVVAGGTQPGPASLRSLREAAQAATSVAGAAA
ncbi:hypothetical protein GCM10009616_08080 [Microlunatus lacustris]